MADNDGGEVSALIRELRKEHKLTQVQLSHELGLSPATIYRYEAGARPDAAALLSLFRFAEKKGPMAIRNALREIVAERISLPGDPELSLEEKNRDHSFDRALKRATYRMRESEYVRVLAFIRFLEENTDSTAEKILNLLLSPWIEQVRGQNSGGKTGEE